MGHNPEVLNKRPAKRCGCIGLCIAARSLRFFAGSNFKADRTAACIVVADNSQSWWHYGSKASVSH